MTLHHDGHWRLHLPPLPSSPLSLLYVGLGPALSEYEHLYMWCHRDSTTRVLGQSATVQLIYTVSEVFVKLSHEIVIVIYKLLKRQSNAKRKAPAYLQAPTYHQDSSSLTRTCKQYEQKSWAKFLPRPRFEPRLTAFVVLLVRSGTNPIFTFSLHVAYMYCTFSVHLQLQSAIDKIILIFIYWHLISLTCRLSRTLIVYLLRSAVFQWRRVWCLLERKKYRLIWTQKRNSRGSARWHPIQAL